MNSDYKTPEIRKRHIRLLGLKKEIGSNNTFKQSINRLEKRIQSIHVKNRNNIFDKKLQNFNTNMASIYRRYKQKQKMKNQRRKIQNKTRKVKNLLRKKEQNLIRKKKIQQQKIRKLKGEMLEILIPINNYIQHGKLGKPLIKLLTYYKNYFYTHPHLKNEAIIFSKLVSGDHPFLKTSNIVYQSIVSENLDRGREPDFQRMYRAILDKINKNPKKIHKYAIIKPLIEQYLGVLPTMNSRQQPITLATPIMNNFQNNNTIESKQMISTRN